MTEIICYICGQPITGPDLDNRIWWHEPDCPNADFWQCDEDEPEWVDCECDVETHVGCVPEWAREDEK